MPVVEISPVGVGELGADAADAFSDLEVGVVLVEVHGPESRSIQEPRCPVLSADMRRPSPPIRLVAVVLAGAMAIVGAPTSGAGEWPTKKPAVRLVVTFERGTSEATRDGVAEDAGTVVSELDQIRTRVVQVPADRAVAVQRRLRADARSPGSSPIR